MVNWRNRVRHPHLLSGLGCLLALLLLVSALPAEPEKFSCVYLQADQMASSAGLMPVTGAPRFQAAVSGGPAGVGVYLTDHHSGQQHWIGSGKAPQVTPDGRYVVFLTRDDRLAPGGLRRGWDIAVYDRVRLRYELINVPADGAQPGELSSPSISADGRFVVFASDRGGLLAGEAGGVSQVYLRDRLAHTTTLLSRAPGGLPAAMPSWQPRISADGREVVFYTAETALVSLGGAIGAPVRCRLTPVQPADVWNVRNVRAWSGR